jgi:uncharacterized SAM-binding protein YcdF (DUF218 family)
MELGILKPLLSSLILPLASLVLLSLVGLLLAIRHKRRGLFLSAVASSALWLLSCQGVAVWLAATVLPQYQHVTAAQLKVRQVQAIVVLGGGIYPQAPEYGQAQPSPATAARLRYGIWLARQTGLPMSFTGGSGWAAAAEQGASEAEVAARVAQQDYGVTLRWLESQSRDTFENASLLTPLLKRDGIRKIALVTDALHMPRSVMEFERQGLVVTPAPTGFVLLTRSAVLQWLPSIDGIAASTRVLHELLGLTVAKLR